MVERLARDHEVVAISRSAPADSPEGVQWVRGDFTDPGDLARLDGYEFDAVVHLASVIGGCSEEDGLRVIVAGTQALTRYAIDRGVRRFVIASSIAVVGSLSRDFFPLEFPIPDDHPCLATDAYSISKALMEEYCLYLGRLHPDLDVTLFRVGSVLRDGSPASAYPIEYGGFAITLMGSVGVVDVVAAFTAALERPARPGVHRINLTGTLARSAGPTVETLRALFGDRLDGVDLAYFARPGHERHNVFATDRLRDLIGVTRVDPADPEGANS
jgi:UDP-glucose 4-epimerase